MYLSKVVKILSGRKFINISNRVIVPKYSIINTNGIGNKEISISQKAMSSLTKNDVISKIGKRANATLEPLSSINLSISGNRSRNNRIEKSNKAKIVPIRKYGRTKNKRYIPIICKMSIKIFTSKLKHIQTYYSNFMGNTICHRSNNLIPPIPPYYNGILVVLRSKIHRSSNRGETLMKIAKKYLYYLCLNIGVTTQTLLGFVICRKRLWDESISNDSNYLCSKPSHIIKCLNIGGSYGYIN